MYFRTPTGLILGGIRFFFGHYKSH